MGIIVAWDDDDQTTLRYTVTGEWTWEDFAASRKEAWKLVESSERTQIDSLLDIDSGSMFPKNALGYFRRMPSSAHPKLKAGTMVMVGNNSIARVLMDVMRILNHQAMEGFLFARTLEEGRHILKKMQERIPS